MEGDWIFFLNVGLVDMMVKCQLLEQSILDLPKKVVEFSECERVKLKSYDRDFGINQRARKPHGRTLPGLTQEKDSPRTLTPIPAKYTHYGMVVELSSRIWWTHLKRQIHTA